ncbi:MULTISPECIES: hypothetical protein [Chryseobacterium]|uniref:hypothetical protein n=1 Tax=Chryseobacterium TaxID=59732 RepID=UPI0024E2650F|nr:hypothetical protein [Chryseobacterium sp.]
MKFNALFLTPIFIYSCAAKNDFENNTEFRKYEIAYHSITHKINQEKPFLKEYNSDASGVKIIPKIYRINKYSIYGSEYFKNENSFSNSMIKRFSKKYTVKNWRRDRKYKVLEINELNKFHGPLQYIYFSEIRNDSLRAEIMGNPFAKYSMTTGEHYLIIFENSHIKSVQKTVGHYD